MNKSAVMHLLVLASLWCCHGTSQVSLKVSPGPNLFEGGFFLLKCFPEDQAEEEEWRVCRNTTKQPTSQPTSQLCGQGWGQQLMNSCKVGLAVTWDSGLYWCQSKEGAVSSTVGIRVESSKLLVVVPMLPVSEGEDVTLTCLDRDRSSVSAHFYRDDLQLTSDPRPDLSLRPVSWSDRGWYKCSARDMESSPALLQVHNRSGDWTEIAPTNSAPEPDSAHTHLVLKVLCHLLVLCPYCISTVLMISLYQRQRPTDGRPWHKEKNEESEDAVAAVTTNHYF
ncbi:hypothetical protein NL108_008825 [Boleophthalmus pectinirostris]|uniref:uncharacterized protein LOC110173732 n=1 Tax=Boleophthalmus pectinirostris TaxID=150288 RepID=UPI00242EF13E|nr:uncharacterized protein LOC110173732 [Boleophthalmus pectinirostris]KAJ0055652.1 hypothetical protein NL108_008825 [Boleophthalmus pectinirostris]